MKRTVNKLKDCLNLEYSIGLINDQAINSLLSPHRGFGIFHS